MELVDAIEVPGTRGHIILVEVRYGDGEPEVYMLATALATGEEAARVRNQFGDGALIRVRTSFGEEGVLYSALLDNRFCEALLTAIGKRRRFRGLTGEIVASHTRAFRTIWGPDHPRVETASSSMRSKAILRSSSAIASI